MNGSHTENNLSAHSFEKSNLVLQRGILIRYKGKIIYGRLGIKTVVYGRVFTMDGDFACRMRDKVYLYGIKQV